MPPYPHPELRGRFRKVLDIFPLEVARRLLDLVGLYGWGKTPKELRVTARAGASITLFLSDFLVRNETV